MATIQMGDLKVSLKGKTLTGTSQDVSSLDDFHLKKITLYTEILKVPSFVIEFYTPNFTTGWNYVTGSLTIESTSYDLTVLKFSPGRMSGYLVKSDYVFERDSSLLSTTLSSSITRLGVRSTISGKYIEVSMNNKFSRLNETCLECCTRLLDMTGEDTVWAILPKEYYIFPTTPSSVTKLTLPTSSLDYYYDRTRMSETNFTALSGATDRYNMYYGGDNIINPRLSKFPVDAISSAVQKRKYRSGWRNAKLTCTFIEDLGLEIGDAVVIQNFSEGVTSFLVTGIMVEIGNKAAHYRYEFSNFTDWEANS